MDGANAMPSGASDESVISAAASISRLDGVSARREAEADRSAVGWVARVLESDGRGILRMLWRILGKEADVMDAYQDCFCKLAAYKKGNDLTSARAFAYRTASNIAIEMIRVRRRREAHWPAVVQTRGHDPESCASVAATNGKVSSEQGDGNVHDGLRAAIAQLPAHLRNVVVLRDLGRMSYEEVGKTLGIDAATARVYRRNAVVRLAEFLKPGEMSE